MNIEPIILSNEAKKEISFNKGYYFIIFSLDENIKLYKNSEIISPNRNNEIYLDSKDIKFIFTKSENEKSGIFINYYCFSSAIILENDILQYRQFSLICPITIIICYSSCNSCNSNKVGTLNENFCTSCKNGFYPIKSNSTNINGFNC